MICLIKLQNAAYVKAKKLEIVVDFGEQYLTGIFSHGLK
jgi:hypothetical protein